MAMRFPVLLAFLLILFLRPAQAQDLTPLPQTIELSCVDRYMQEAEHYWPVVGDILRFNAMFENYVQLCQRKDPKQLEAIKPFIKSMKARAAQDVDDSYRVMARIIHTRVPADMPAACRADRSARDKATEQFQAAMDAQAEKAASRLKRSAGDMDQDKGGEVCHNLVAIKDEVEKHMSGRTLNNPLYQIAFLRGMASDPGNMQQTKMYQVYRSVLHEIQDNRLKSAR